MYMKLDSKSVVPTKLTNPNNREFENPQNLHQQLRRVSAFSMSHRRSEYMAVEEGSDESVYTIPQILSFLRAAYRDRDFKKAEKLLTLREERIKEELDEEVKKTMVETEKKMKVVEKLKKEVERALVVKVELEERLRRECEDLREECLKLKGKIADVEKAAEKRVKELELKVEEEFVLRKKAEEELEVWMSKCKELELKLPLEATVGILDAGAQGSEMEVEGEVQAAVKSPGNQFGEGTLD